MFGGNYVSTRGNSRYCFDKYYFYINSYYQKIYFKSSYYYPYYLINNWILYVTLTVFDNLS